MTDQTITASIIPLHQPARPKTPAERAKAYRERKRAKATGPAGALVAVDPLPADNPARLPHVEPSATVPASEVLRHPAPRPRLKVGAQASGTDIVAKAGDLVVGQVTHAVTLPTEVTPVTPSHRHVAPILFTVSALALGAVGITMNGWFARSLGSSESAGWRSAWPPTSWRWQCPRAPPWPGKHASAARRSPAGRSGP